MPTLFVHCGKYEWVRSALKALRHKVTIQPWDEGVKAVRKNSKKVCSRSAPDWRRFVDGAVDSLEEFSVGQLRAMCNELKIPCKPASSVNTFLKLNRDSIARRRSRRGVRPSFVRAALKRRNNVLVYGVDEDAQGSRFVCSVAVAQIAKNRSNIKLDVLCAAPGFGKSTVQQILDLAHALGVGRLDLCAVPGIRFWYRRQHFADTHTLCEDDETWRMTYRIRERNRPRSKKNPRARKTNLSVKKGSRSLDQLR